MTVISLFLLLSVTLAIPINEKDVHTLQKQRRTETLLYEECVPTQISSFAMLGAQFDRYLTKDLYIGGSAYGAVSGGRGGYALGGFQVGYIHDITASLYIDAKVLLGGSGGGGVPVKGGLLVQPMLTIGYRLSADMDLRLGCGKYVSLDNDFQASIVNFGVSFSSWHIFLPF